MSMCSSTHKRSSADGASDAKKEGSIGTILDKAATTKIVVEVTTTLKDGLGMDDPVSSSSMRSSTGKRSTSKRVRGVDGFRQRAAALCLRRASDNNEWEVLLVSGRGGKDYWVLPGGGLEKEESAEEAVIREFREEAGVQGAIVAPIGEFTDEERCHRTVLFLTSAMEMFDDWEDFRTGRERRWMGASETLQKIKKNQAAMLETSLRIAVKILDGQQATLEIKSP